jgi:DNA adenine methylase
VANLPTPPFPWFGGKRQLAPMIWEGLGDCQKYIEPFAGSLACLLGRPAWHKGRIEIVNDMDCHLANFWRSVRHKPEKLIEHTCDPINEADLFARHIWLLKTRTARAERILASPTYCDPKAAGWWVWGVCSWIGGGWCSGDGSWTSDGKKIFKKNGPGVHQKKPAFSPGGGVLSGASRQLPSLAGSSGILRGGGNRRARVAEKISVLSSRLEDTVVCCGDWSRVVTDGALNCNGPVGVFLDPPYLGEGRSEVYAKDSDDVASLVAKWAMLAGEDTRIRVAFTCYRDQHKFPESWRCLPAPIKARPYPSKKGRKTRGDINRAIEVLWLSPGCDGRQPGLFDN